MRHVALLALVMSGCTHGTATEKPATPGVHRAPDWLPAASIHASTMQHVAMTEQGDAAVSSDSLGEVRLWPTLDGTREPVQVPLDRPTELAIAHADDELLVASLDEAGIVTLERLSRGGALRSKIALPAEPPIEQVVAIDGGVLVVRNDQTIERYDATGTRRGRLAADPGEHLGMLARRRGGAAVMTFAEATSTAATSVRFIVLGDELVHDSVTWGRRIALPAQLDPQALALSPNHQRLAVFDSIAHTLRVLDVTPSLHDAGLAVALPNTRVTLGFTDDDHVVAINGIVTWWPAMSPSSRLLLDTDPKLDDGEISADDGAIGDHLAVGPASSALAIATPGTVRYLGWAEDTRGALAPAGSGFAMVAGAQILKLDAGLRVTGSIPSEAGAFGRPLWLDDHRALVLRAAGDKVSLWTVDTANPGTDTMLATYDHAASLDYDSDLREVAVIAPLVVYRLKLDPTLRSATRLPDLVTSEEIQVLRLIDPATHDGVIAVAASRKSGRRWEYLEWHDGSEPTLEPTPAEPRRGKVYAIDRTGAIYVADSEGVTVWRRDKSTSLTDKTANVAPTHDGRFVATFGDSKLVMRDSKGHVLWTRALWDRWTASMPMFSADERRLVVQAPGGLLEVDAATGERIATACAFQFGIHDKAPAIPMAGVPTVCTE